MIYGKMRCVTDKRGEKVRDGKGADKNLSHRKCKAEKADD